MDYEVIKLDYFGRGIVKDNNKVIFVNKALPYDIINIKIIKDKKKYSEAYITNIKKNSPYRIESVCPYFNQCGGCDFLNTNSELEKEFKINKALELIGRCDGFYDTKEDHYRNKITLHVKNNQVGLYEEKSNDIINIDSCYIVDPMINNVIKNLKQIDYTKYQINKIIIKCHQKHLLLWVDNEIDNDFINKLNNVDTIVCNSDIIKGNGYLEEEIDNRIFKITSNAFFQVNKEGLLNILKIIKIFLKDKKINKVLDLYSGTSVWGILISDLSKEITCIEVNKEACDNALENIKKNRINNIKIINGKAKDYLNQFKNIDLIIVDPPRSGLDKKTIGYLKKINSQYMIYISCDMISLKRDLDLLNEIYQIKECYLVNMFKRTYHVETVCLLCRKSVDK